MLMKFLLLPLGYGLKVLLVIIGVTLLTLPNAVAAKTLTMPEVSAIIQNHFENIDTKI